ncbi:hypothetical protein IVG45_16510 [Methylomonas sp. LL1]|uniref:hypothetical protein n=1 Tax=Methylomonas sp. LL1 TaxID=2785785 RepID=UPI0018C37559|nr:hypothetical protein [Methylomonas sp. LL1]QPK62442.1 hypothetical protein IVG45_16510 [Methylomonas sp. LL1]
MSAKLSGRSILIEGETAFILADRLTRSSQNDADVRYKLFVLKFLVIRTIQELQLSYLSDYSEVGPINRAQERIFRAKEARWSLDLLGGLRLRQSIFPRGHAGMAI